jgi:hypothetical protein
MAKRSKKGAKAKRGTFNEAMKALEGVEVPTEQIGQLGKDGIATMDLHGVEQLKKKLGQKAWSKVRFVALNAPFKRRSPVSPT